MSESDHHPITGNFYGEGDIRKSEIVAAAGLLGIDADRVQVLDHPELQVRAWVGCEVCW